MDRLQFDAASPAFSFTYDGQPFAASAADWQVTPESEGLAYRHSTGLVVTAEYRVFPAQQAVEVMLRLSNEGSQPTGIIADLLPVDLFVPLPQEAPAQVHHARGSLCQMADFQPLVTALPAGETLQLQPQGGRSSNGVLPFADLQAGEGGLVIAVGWSGQWVLRLQRADDGLRLTAGQAQTHFRLLPGESLRTPRLLLLPYEGQQAHRGPNLLRQLILQEYTPRDAAGQPCLPPLSHNTMMTYYLAGTTDEAQQLEILQRCVELGLEAFWIDACWYGTVGNSPAPEDGWAANAGNWFYNRQNFPEGLARIGRATAAAGLDFVVWFEPERVYAGSLIEREHPEYVLRLPDNPTGLFNLGDPEARAYLADLLSGFITEAGITIYRQDFNMDPLAYWAAADEADRVGVSEMKYVAGLYLLWDELRARHPGLRIDNCSSGGRRIDLETVSRSYPLWRSDFSDAGGPRYGLGLPVADQVVTGLSTWVPLHGGPVWSAEPYRWRSALAAGASLYGNIHGEGFPVDLTREALAELRRLRPLLLGDYYRLHPVTTEYHDWSACQFHDPTSDRGLALFFRRHESPFPSLEAQLEGIDALALYEVVIREGYSEDAREVMNGHALECLPVIIDSCPGSLLIEYSKV